MPPFTENRMLALLKHVREILCRFQLIFNPLTAGAAYIRVVVFYYKDIIKIKINYKDKI